MVGDQFKGRIVAMADGEDGIAIGGNGKVTWECLAARSHYRASGMARAAGVSLRTLQRYFRARHNCTVSHWLRALRLEEARARLAKCDSVKEVAFELGYKQPSHFTRDFKGRFGVSPRTLMRGKINVRFDGE